MWDFWYLCAFRPHFVAASLADGAIPPVSFRPETMARPEIGALRDRIAVNSYDADIDLGDMSPAHPESDSIVSLSGERLTRQVTCVDGGPKAL